MYNFDSNGVPGLRPRAMCVHKRVVVVVVLGVKIDDLRLYQLDWGGRGAV